MRLLIIFITLLISGIYIFAEFIVDDIAKNIIENKATEAAQREVKIENLKIDFLKEQINLKNISIKNNDGFPGELLKIKDIQIFINIKSLTSETVELKLVDIMDINFEYKVSIRNGQIVDNLSLINQALKQQRNVGSEVNKNEKTYTQKDKDKNFIPGVQLSYLRLKMGLDVEGPSPDEMMLDIGPEAVASYSAVIREAKTVLWNGPMGAFEIPPFDVGTNGLARYVADCTADGLVSIAGGGDTVAALNHAGCADKFSYISLAGGAFLEWIEGRELPGIAILDSAP